MIDTIDTNVITVYPKQLRTKWTIEEPLDLKIPTEAEADDMAIKAVNEMRKHNPSMFKKDGKLKLTYARGSVLALLGLNHATKQQTQMMFEPGTSNLNKTWTNKIKRARARALKTKWCER
jgi:hypothetical protein